MSWKYVIPVNLNSSQMEEGMAEKSLHVNILNTTVFVLLKCDEEHILHLQCECGCHCGYNNNLSVLRGREYEFSTCVSCEKHFRPLETAHQMMLIDNLGFIIGNTGGIGQVVPTDKNCRPNWQPLYKDHTKNQKLSRDALMKHVPDGLPDTTFYVVVTSMPEVPCDQAFALQNVMESSCQRPYGTSLNLEKLASKKFILQGRAQVEIDGAHINSLIKKSEFFDKLIQKYSNERDSRLKLDDVDAAAFEMLVEVNHYGKDVYMNTDMDRTLAQCCRDLLVVANQLLCHEVAEICAQCIIQITTRDTVLADILLLANHYNGERKLEVISSLGEKIRDLKPDNK